VRVPHALAPEQLDAEMMAFSREWDRALTARRTWLDAAVWGLARLSKVITHLN
jgi:hypothetical protein